MLQYYPIMNQIVKDGNNISIKPYPISKEFANRDLIERDRIYNELKRLNKNGAGDTEFGIYLQEF